MKKSIILLSLLLIGFSISCTNAESQKNKTTQNQKNQRSIINKQYDPIQDGEYLLAMSEAYNLIAKKQYVPAGNIVNEYLLLEQDYPDAYFIMGKILLARRMYKEAEKNFFIAEEQKQSFILSERVMELYWNQAEAFNRGSFSETLIKSRIGAQVVDFDTTTGLSLLEERTYQTLIKLIDYAKVRLGRYYRENEGRASFILGRLLYERKTMLALENFLAAIQNKFLAKESYLYMAYLFAAEDQTVINDIYRLEKGDNFTPPQKRSAFLLYYNNFRDTPTDQMSKKYKNKLIPREEYELLLYTVSTYFNSLQ